MASLSADRPTFIELAIRHAVIAGKLRARLPDIESARLARSISRLADASSAASRDALDAALQSSRGRDFD